MWHRVQTRDLTSILTKYQYTDTGTSYFDFQILTVVKWGHLKALFKGKHFVWKIYWNTFRFWGKFQYIFQTKCFPLGFEGISYNSADTDTSYFKNVLKYWYFSIFFISIISIFLKKFYLHAFCFLLP
jgi:hypothetical protein